MLPKSRSCAKLHGDTPPSGIKLTKPFSHGTSLISNPLLYETCPAGTLNSDAFYYKRNGRGMSANIDKYTFGFDVIRYLIGKSSPLFPYPLASLPPPAETKSRM
jgi:hypothetical protein